MRTPLKECNHLDVVDVGAQIDRLGLDGATKVEIVEGSALNREDIQAGMAGCDAVHINCHLSAEEHFNDHKRPLY